MIKFSVETFVLYNSGRNFVEISLLLKKKKVSTSLCFRYSTSLPIVLPVSQKLQNTEMQDFDDLYRNIKNNKINFKLKYNSNAILCESEFHVFTKSQLLDILKNL